MSKQIAGRLFYLLVCASASVFAQTLPEYGMRGAERAKDLQLPTEVSDVDLELTPQMALFKPDGKGPFPALVLQHQCGGLRNNTSMLNWTKEAVARGYVTLLLDSFGQRGVDQVCRGPKGDVIQSRGVKDALQAAAHLRQLAFVDKKRVAFAGYSWGAGNGLLVSSKRAADALGRFDRFDAVVSFYPPCNNYPTNGTQPYTLISSDIDRPLLVLLGGRDTETPPQECIDGLKPLKEAGAPIAWHFYPEATHCWDCEQLNGLRKVDIRGSAVEYVYDKNVTKDSVNRMFSFFEKAFASRP